MTALSDRRPRSTGYRSRIVAAGWAVLALAALLGIWELSGTWSAGVRSGHDFVQDYAAIVKIAQGRNPYEPYNDVTQELFGGPPHRGNLYSFHAPSSLPFFLWLLPVDRLAGYAGAYVAWGVASLAGLWAICWLTCRALGAARPVPLGGLAALALLVLPPIRENFEEGQLNVLVVAGVLGCWAARRASRPVLAGMLLGAAFALKPIPGLFFLYYLWRQDWHLLGASVVALAALAVGGIALSGLDGAWMWATVNYPDHAAVWPGYPDNASVRGFFTRLFGPSEWRPRPPYPIAGAATGLTLASGALLAALGWLAACRPRDLARDDDLEIAALLVFTLLVTPIVWPHYYVVLILPVALVAAALVRLVRALWRPEHSGDNRATERPGDDAATERGEWARALAGPTAALAVLGVAGTVLGAAHYVEPYRGVGGQQLVALLAVYMVSLLALRWSRPSAHLPRRNE